MRRLVLAVSLAATTALSVNGAPNCLVGGATIFYGNGVNTTHVKAVASANLLQATLFARLAQTLSIDQSCIVVKLAYDPAVSQGESIAAIIINIAVQGGLIVSVQVANQFIPSFPIWLAEPWNAPPWFAIALKLFTLTSLSLQQPVRQSHLDLYTEQLNSGNKVIVVAHSQGNLYVNDVYVGLASPDNTKFSVVGVATPASHVAGNGPYITLINDIITLLPGSLAPNTTNSPRPAAVCSTIATGLPCHYFDSSYLPGLVSGARIIDSVINSIPVSLRIAKTGAGGGTVTSLPSGIDCGPVCIAAFPQFAKGRAPQYVGINNMIAGTSTTITLTAAATPGSNFTGWSGACLAIGGILGNSITFPILVSSSVNCSANFDLQSVLRVTRSGSGDGTVTSIPAGVNCGINCIAPFPPTVLVQLVAAAGAGSAFAGWGGDCAGASANPTALVSLTASKTCDAKFELGGMKFTSIDYPDARFTRAFGINGSGQIVGTYGDSLASVEYYQHGFLYDTHGFTVIDYPPGRTTSGARIVGTELYGINDSGLIVGAFFDQTGVYHGFLYNSGSFTLINYSAAGQSNVFGINNLHGVVGFYQAGVVSHGFLYNAGSFTLIDHPGVLGATVPYSINVAGQIVGSYGSSGFLYDAGSFSLINYSALGTSVARGINDSSQIVGVYSEGASIVRGFLKSTSGFKLIDYPGAKGTAAYGINNKGQLAGEYFDSSGKRHGFVAVP